MYLVLYIKNIKKQCQKNTQLILAEYTKIIYSSFYFLLNLPFTLSTNFFLVFTTSTSPSIWSSHFSERRIAIGLVEGILASTILIITIIGTDKSIPTTHQIAPQNQREIIITKGLKFNLFQTNFGSIIFHISVCIPTKNEVINTKV